MSTLTANTLTRDSAVDYITGSDRTLYNLNNALYLLWNISNVLHRTGADREVFAILRAKFDAVNAEFTRKDNAATR